MKKLFYLLIFQSIFIFSCTIKFKNDSDKMLFILNPNSQNGIYLSPGQESDINPSIKENILKYLMYGRLNIYTSDNKQANKLILAYELIEKKCLNENISLTFSDIQKIAKIPTERFEVKQKN